eukprot:1191676-Prorocentrum_minimum.AAC.7
MAGCTLGVPFRFSTVRVKTGCGWVDGWALAALPRVRQSYPIAVSDGRTTDIRHRTYRNRMHIRSTHGRRPHGRRSDPQSLREVVIWHETNPDAEKRTN